MKIIRKSIIQSQLGVILSARINLSNSLSLYEMKNVGGVAIFSSSSCDEENNKGGKILGENIVNLKNSEVRKVDNVSNEGYIIGERNIKIEKISGGKENNNSNVVQISEGTSVNDVIENINGKDVVINLEDVKVYKVTDAQKGFYGRVPVSQGGGLIRREGFSDVIKSKKFYKELAYNENMYVLGKFPYVTKLSEGLTVERGWLLDELNEFKNQIPEGVIISCLITASSAGLNFSVTKSFFLARNVDVEIVSETIARDLSEKLRYYVVNMVISELNLIIGYRKWFTELLLNDPQWLQLSKRNFFYLL